MKTKTDQLVARLAAMDADFAEWDLAAPNVSAAMVQLFDNMQRHLEVGSLLASRAGSGKDIDAQVAELIQVFRSHEPLFRNLAVSSFRAAEIAKRISAQLENLNEPQ